MDLGDRHPGALSFSLVFSLVFSLYSALCTNRPVELTPTLSLQLRFLENKPRLDWVDGQRFAEAWMVYILFYITYFVRHRILSRSPRPSSFSPLAPPRPFCLLVLFS